MKLGMWDCGKLWAQVLSMWSVVTKCAYLIPRLHICSDWLITKKSNIKLCKNMPTWYVGSDGHKYYPRSLFSPNTHIYIRPN